jgi:hypothetical protein
MYYDFVLNGFYKFSLFDVFALIGLYFIGVFIGVILKRNTPFIVPVIGGLVISHYIVYLLYIKK